jgi:putative ABC transport system permease protein
MTRRPTHFLIRLAAWLVPGDLRQEWREEWIAEVDALEAARAEGASALPRLNEFAMGALPHAVWMRTEGWTMDSVLQDVRYSFRVLRLNPGFTLVAALTLALGIGANASIFSLVDGLLFRAPAQIEQPERLVQIARSYESAPRWDNFSWPAVRTIREEAQALSGVAAYSGRAFVLGRGAEIESVLGEYVSGEFFSLLGV